MVAGLYTSGANTNANKELESSTYGTNNIDLQLLEKFNKVLFQRPGSRALSVPSYFPFASINFSTNSNLFLKANQPTEYRLKSGHK